MNQDAPTADKPMPRWPVVVGALGAAILVVAGLAGWLSAGKAREPSGERAGLAEVNALNEMARRASVSGENDKALAFSDESARKLRDLASKASGDERLLMEYASELAATQNEITRAFVSDSDAYVAAGGGDLGGLTDAGALEKRVGLLERTIASHGAFVAYFAGVEDRIGSDLRARGASAGAIREFVEGFRGQAKIDNLVRIHELQRAILEEERERFAILQRFPGQWKQAANGVELGAAVPTEQRARFAAMESEIVGLREKMKALVQERNAPK